MQKQNLLGLTVVVFFYLFVSISRLTGVGEHKETVQCIQSNFYTIASYDSNIDDSHSDAGEYELDSKSINKKGNKSFRCLLSGSYCALINLDLSYVCMHSAAI